VFHKTQITEKNALPLNTVTAHLYLYLTTCADLCQEYQLRLNIQVMSVLGGANLIKSNRLITWSSLRLWIGLSSTTDNKKHTAHGVYNAMRNSKNMRPTTRREVWGVSMKDFGVYWVGGVCGNSVGILWKFPLIFLWVWNGYGNWSPIPTAALVFDRAVSEYSH